MTDIWTERLSEYLDDDLDEGRSKELETHLETCEACRSVLDGLRAVADRAAGLEARDPTADLWPGIAERIGATPAPEVVVLPLRKQTPFRVQFSLPQLAAAALALMVVSAGTVMSLRGGAAGAPVIEVAGSAANVTFASEPEYELAVAELEQVIAAGRERLDPETIRVLEENLEAIDAAIREARRALAVDPGSAYLNSYLARTMRRKLTILERGGNIIAAASL